MGNRRGPASGSTPRSARSRSGRNLRSPSRWTCCSVLSRRRRSSPWSDGGSRNSSSSGCCRSACRSTRTCERTPELSTRRWQLPCSSPDRRAAAPRSSSASWAAIPHFVLVGGAASPPRPVPPPRPERYPDSGRVMLADTELRQMATVVSGLDAIHHYHGRMPKECVSTMSLAFLSGAIHGVLPGSLLRRLPRQRVLAATRIRRAPARAADPPATLPAAALALEVTGRPPRAADALGRLPRRTARRDTPGPLTVLPSTTSLIANLRWAHSDRVDFAETAGSRAIVHRELDGG